MKRSRFTEEQIVAILAEADRGEQTISAVCRAHGVSEATFYNWRAGHLQAARSLFSASCPQPPHYGASVETRA